MAQPVELLGAAARMPGGAGQAMLDADDHEHLSESTSLIPQATGAFGNITVTALPT